jgi:hypothetical protein
MGPYATQLASVRAAMAKIEASGQRYEIHSDGGSGRMLERADYRALAERERLLIPLADQEALGRTGRRMRTLSTGL